MDSINETGSSRSNTPQILAEQIRKDFDSLGKTPKAELITAGADSHIYLIKSSGQEPLIAKLYNVSPLTPADVQSYADKTNWLKSYLKQTPYIAEVSLSGGPWVAQFDVNEVLVSGVANGTPYTLSPFVSGQDFEQMVLEAQSDKSKPYALVPSMSGNNSPMTTQDILDLHRETFELHNPNRVELDFNQHINHLLGASHFNVQPLNLKLRIDNNTRNITFVATDIAGNVAKALQTKRDNS